MQKKLNHKNVAVVLFLLSVMLIPFYYFRFNIFSIPTTLYEIALYFSFAISAYSSFSRDKLKKPITIAGAVLVAIALLSAFYPNGLARALGIWRSYFFDGLILMANYILLKDRLDTKVIIRTIIYSSAAVATIALIMFALGTQTVDGRLLDLDKISPNYLSLYLSSIITLAVVYIAEVEKKNTVLICSTFLMLIALYLTYSRGGVVAIVVAIAFYLASRVFKKNKFKNLIYVLLVIVFLIGGYTLFKPDFGAYGRVGNSSNIRFYIWETSLEIVKKNPIVGVGLNNYQTYFTELTRDRINFPEYISPQALTAHNLYLHLLVIGGPVLLLAFIFLVYKSGFNRSDNYLKFALMSLLIYGVIDTPFFRNDLAAFFWLIIAIASQKNTKNENSD